MRSENGGGTHLSGWPGNRRWGRWGGAVIDRTRKEKKGERRRGRGRSQYFVAVTLLVGEFGASR